MTVFTNQMEALEDTSEAEAKGEDALEAEAKSDVSKDILLQEAKGDVSEGTLPPDPEAKSDVSEGTLPPDPAAKSDVSGGTLPPDPEAKSDVSGGTLPPDPEAKSDVSGGTLPPDPEAKSDVSGGTLPPEAKSDMSEGTPPPGAESDISMGTLPPEAKRGVSEGTKLPEAKKIKLTIPDSIFTRIRENTTSQELAPQVSSCVGPCEKRCVLILERYVPVPKEIEPSVGGGVVKGCIPGEDSVQLSPPKVMVEEERAMLTSPLTPKEGGAAKKGWLHLSSGKNEEAKNLSPLAKIEKVGGAAKKVCLDLSPAPALSKSEVGGGAMKEACHQPTDVSSLSFSPEMEGGFGENMINTQLNKQIKKVELFLKMDRLKRHK